MQFGKNCGNNGKKFPFSSFLSKYYLYFIIKRYEKVFSAYGFNKKFLHYEDVLAMLEKFSVIPVEDRTYSCPFLLFSRKDGKRILVYNPDEHPERLVLTLGHELGHLMCGHYKEDVLNGKSNLRINARNERDADIIGYLCWIPTFYLNRKSEEFFDVEVLLKDLTDCDTDYEFFYENLPARLRIYRAYLKAREKVKQMQDVIEEIQGKKSE